MLKMYRATFHFKNDYYFTVVYYKSGHNRATIEDIYFHRNPSTTDKRLKICKEFTPTSQETIEQAPTLFVYTRTTQTSLFRLFYNHTPIFNVHRSFFSCLKKHKKTIEKRV